MYCLLEDLACSPWVPAVIAEGVAGNLSQVLVAAWLRNDSDSPTLSLGPRVFSLCTADLPLSAVQSIIGIWVTDVEHCPFSFETMPQCVICGAADHRIRDCPLKHTCADANDNAGLHCWNCLERGHLSHECRSKTGKPFFLQRVLENRRKFFQDLEKRKESLQTQPAADHQVALQPVPVGPLALSSAAGPPVVDQNHYNFRLSTLEHITAELGTEVRAIAGAVQKLETQGEQTQMLLGRLVGALEGSQKLVQLDPPPDPKRLKGGNGAPMEQ